MYVLNKDIIHWFAPDDYEEFYIGDEVKIVDERFPNYILVKVFNSKYSTTGVEMSLRRESVCTYLELLEYKKQQILQKIREHQKELSDINSKINEHNDKLIS